LSVGGPVGWLAGLSVGWPAGGLVGVCWLIGWSAPGGCTAVMSASDGSDAELEGMLDAIPSDRIMDEVHRLQEWTRVLLNIVGCRNNFPHLAASAASRPPAPPPLLPFTDVATTTPAPSPSPSPAFPERFDDPSPVRSRSRSPARRLRLIPPAWRFRFGHPQPPPTGPVIQGPTPSPQSGPADLGQLASSTQTGAAPTSAPALLAPMPLSFQPPGMAQ